MHPASIARYFRDVTALTGAIVTAEPNSTGFTIEV